MLPRDFSFRHGVSHKAVCTITAVSKDLVRGRLRISYDQLGSPPYARNWGCLLGGPPATDPPGKLLDQFWGRGDALGYVRITVPCRKHPRDFWRDVFGKNS